MMSLEIDWGTEGMADVSPRFRVGKVDIDQAAHAKRVFGGESLL
jgi:hypothetical protein